MSSNYADVEAFHKKFGVKTNPEPGLLEESMAEYRAKFFEEETREFREAVEQNNLEEMIDACIDLIFIAHGTLNIMGIDEKTFQKCWDEVQRANMDKISGKDARDLGILTTKVPRHDSDVLKRLDWTPPSFKRILGVVSR